MAFVATTFKLDLTPGASRPVIYASAGDVGRPFTASLYWNGEAWSASGTTPVIRGKKPDATVFEYMATVSGSSVTFSTTEQMTIIPGPVECELVFTSGDDVVASANFVLIVEDSPYDPNNLSESEVEGLTDVLAGFQRLNRDSNGVVKIGDGVTASGTAEPIKGFYVHDEATDTDGVAKYDYDELENVPRVVESTKNLLDVNTLETGNIMVGGGVVTGTASAFFSAFRNGFTNGIEFEENERYIFSGYFKNDNGGSGNGLIIKVHHTDETVGSWTLSNSVTEYTLFSLASTAGKTVSYFSFEYASGGSNVWHIKDMMVTKGNVVTQYIPFETAADYVARESIENIEAEIDTLATTENNNNVKVVKQLLTMNSYNLFSFSKSASTMGGITFSFDEGILSATGTSTSGTYYDIVSSSIAQSPFEAGEQYYIQTKLSNKNKDGHINIYFNTGSGLVLTYEGLVGTNHIEIPKNCNFIIVRYYVDSGLTLNVETHVAVSKALPNNLLDNSAEFRFVQAFGTGDCTIIKFLNGETLVIDFGLNEAQDVLYRNWGRAISDLKITHIDYAIISHYHGDHVGMIKRGLGDLIDSNTTFFLPNGHPFTTQELEALAWVDEQANDNIVENYNAVMLALETADCKLVYPQENDIWIIGGAKIQFWNADHTEWMAKYIAHEDYDYNTCSLCNYITIGTQRVAFTGDISVPVMEKYKKTVLPCQIVKANHHGVGYAIVPLFMSSLLPDVSVIMLGYNLAIDILSTSPYQNWCENNFVPNYVTGINDHNLSLKVTKESYIWNTPARRYIAGDES